jgi:hypothetical protein
MIVTQQAQDGIAATARTKDGACSEAGPRAPASTTPARPDSRRCAPWGHNTGGAPSSPGVTVSLTRLLLEASGVATQEADEHA